MRKFVKVTEEQYRNDVYTLEFYSEDKKYENIKLPQRATSKSAGYDIYSPMSFQLPPKCTYLVPTGFKVCMKDDEVMLIFIRSSLGIKKGISIANGTGVIDADYYNNSDNEGHVWLALKNNSNNGFIVKKGDRLAQAVFVKYQKVDDDEPISEERSGGIGSTDKKEK